MPAGGMEGATGGVVFLLCPAFNGSDEMEEGAGRPRQRNIKKGCIRPISPSARVHQG